ncbi:hypothetical protein DOY81_000700 [Sarcophaga bullata]|nr:hypothetical protein DOY81_000700 [Sarcophaga bullata]
MADVESSSAVQQPPSSTTTSLAPSNQNSNDNNGSANNSSNNSTSTTTTTITTPTTTADANEPLSKKQKLDHPSTSSSLTVQSAAYEKLESRLGGILCCAVCLDLPKTAMYQCKWVI